MTLIQTILCRDLIIQVSDRRLTRGNGILVDDNTNKSILWCNTVSIGFTGIAFIDKDQKVPTSRWITEALVGVDITNLSAGIETLRGKVQDKVNELPARFKERRLTITANGLAMQKDKKSGVSFYLSNFELEDKTLATAQPEFVVGQLAVNNVVKFEYLTSGANVPLGIGRDCRRGVSAALRAGNVDQAVRILIETQRRVAVKNNTVGSDALIVTLPRTTDLGTPSILMSSAASATMSGTTPTFTFVRPGLFDHHVHGPNTVCGETAMGSVEVKADPDNLDNFSISVEMIATPGMSSS